MSDDADAAPADPDDGAPASSKAPAATRTERIRTVEIRPPSVARETVFVAKTAFHILFWSAFVIFGRAPPDDAAREAARESPFDVAFKDLDGADQRVFRLLQEGMVEAENKRSLGGKWPTGEELAKESIPPFAPDPIDKSGYSWRSLQGAGVVDYIGTPAKDSGRPTFIAIVTEPPPGTASDPNAKVDEIHHRLSDGTMIHVTLFMGPGLDDAKEPVAFVAAEAGWRRVVTSTSQAPPP